MEYLTLQDIPHRHFYDPRRMASPDEIRASERALPGMAAVREPFPSSPTLVPAPSDSSHLPILEPTPRPAPPSTPLPLKRPFAETPLDPALLAAPAVSYYVPTMAEEHRAAQTLAGLPYGGIREEQPSDSEPQNHHIRHSPPLQADEQRGFNQEKLPSFKQLITNITGEPSPPRTPSRKPSSVESSPVSRGPHPPFGEVEWSEASKRRRIDSACTDMRGSISNETTYTSSRRPSVIDPALSGPYSDRRDTVTGYPQPHLHRPSYSYAPQPAPSMANQHMRHQSTPAPYGHNSHASYQHHGPSSSTGAPMYPPPPHYSEHRPSYFSDARPTVPPHSDYRPHDPYYGQSQSAYGPPPQHAGYDSAHYPPPQPTYSNYTFQASMSMDQNGFSRKRRGNLPKEATQILKAWFNGHRDSPYPTEDEKIELCRQTQLTMNQVSNWFINARRRAPAKEQRDAREPAEEA